MKKKIALGLVLLVGFLVAIQYWEPAKQPFYGDLNESVTIIRDGYDLGALQQVSELDTVAMLKCHDMTDRNYFDHKSPDGKLLWEQYKYDYVKSGENLAINIDSASEVAKAWANSKTHLDNLVDPAYTQVGYAVCINKSNFYQVVQVLR